MKINNFLYLIGGTCLFLQGCETWHVNNKETNNLNETSTLISPKIEETPTVTSELVLETQLKKQNFRAQPRRPLLDKTVEEDSKKSSQLDNKTIFYTVQKGDTLYQIARNFHVTVNQLVQANNLNSSNHLSIGMLLNIPSEDNLFMPTTNVYTVQKGDTLTSIAAQFHTTIAELKQKNKLTKDTIYVGQKLLIDGTSGSKKIANPKDMSSSPLVGEKYIVKAGDVLYNIAKRCGISVRELMQINNIQDPKALQIGQVLYLKQITNTIPEKQLEIPQSSSTSEITPNIHSDITEEANLNGPQLVEEDNFEDLFEESKDIPVIPMEEIK